MCDAREKVICPLTNGHECHVSAFRALMNNPDACARDGKCVPCSVEVVQSAVSIYRVRARVANKDHYPAIDLHGIAAALRAAGV